MRPVSFGKVVVATAGTPVQLGVSTLNGGIGAHDTQIVVSSAAPFCADMLPFELHLDAGTASAEAVMVTAMNGTTFTVQRGIFPNQFPAVAHLTAAPIKARFLFTEMFLSGVGGLTGKAWLGSASMTTGGGSGTIKEFEVTPASGLDDTWSLPVQDNTGDTNRLTDYKLDVAVNGEGLYVTLWVR